MIRVNNDVHNVNVRSDAGKFKFLLNNYLVKLKSELLLIKPFQINEKIFLEEIKFSIFNLKIKIRKLFVSIIIKGNELAHPVLRLEGLSLNDTPGR